MTLNIIRRKIRQMVLHWCPVSSRRMGRPSPRRRGGRRGRRGRRRRRMSRNAIRIILLFPLPNFPIPTPTACIFTMVGSPEVRTIQILVRVNGRVIIGVQTPLFSTKFPSPLSAPEVFYKIVSAPSTSHCSRRIIPLSIPPVSITIIAIIPSTKCILMVINGSSIGLPRGGIPIPPFRWGDRVLIISPDPLLAHPSTKENKRRAFVFSWWWCNLFFFFSLSFFSLLQQSTSKKKNVI